MEAQRDLIISTLDIMKFNMRMLEEENEKLKKENKDNSSLCSSLSLFSFFNFHFLLQAFSY